MADFSHMTLKELTGARGHDCACGRHHVCGLEYLSIAPGALNGITDMLKALGSRRPYIICDRNTLAAAGQRVCALLDRQGVPYVLYTIPCRGERIAPAEWEVGSAVMHFDPRCDLILGVGSGVVNDICKVVARATGRKNAIVGIHIFYGANAGSSDADVRDVNIIGTGGTDSVGIFAEGFDNTFTNIRIGHVFVGVHLRSGANVLRNIHPLYYSDYTDYENSCGFLDASGSNVYDFCYSDQFCVGFRTLGDISNVYSNCYCYWYSAAGGREIGFRADGKFNSVVTNARLTFRGDTNNAVLQTTRFFGKGTFDNLLVQSSLVKDRSYRRFLRGSFFWLLNRWFG